jgi:hypothetical protein
MENFYNARRESNSDEDENMFDYSDRNLSEGKRSDQNFGN